jgi:hypothetical protein
MLLFLALVVGVTALRMDAVNATTVRDILVLAGLLPVSPATAAEIDLFAEVGLAFGPPECPTQNRFYSCDENATVDSLQLHGQQQPTVLTFGFLIRSLRFSSRESQGVLNMSSMVCSFPVAFRSSNFTRLEGRDLVVPKQTVDDPAGLFPFLSHNLVLSNVTFYDGPFPDETWNFTSCSFTDVLFRCPIPPFLKRCFTEPNPPCMAASTPSPMFAPSFPCLSCTSTCVPPPSKGVCAISQPLLPVPAQRGISVLELSVGDEQLYLSSLTVSSSGVVGLVNRLEALDWRTRSWKILFDQPQRKRRPGTSETFLFAFVLTTRVRLTVEQWFDTHEIVVGNVGGSTWAYSPPRTSREIAVNCDPATSVNQRSMLDETVGDSFCMGRACQAACVPQVPSREFSRTFWFQRTVKAQFLVIEGGDPWIGGQLVASTSDNTRVYKLDGRETKEVNVTGVGDFKRVRLVGDPVGVSLPPPTLPNRLGLPGVFVKTYRSTVPTGGVTLSVGDGGGLVAPNGTVVSVARVQNQTFAATDDGAIWQVNGTVWTALTGFASLNLNVNEKAPARRLVVVGDRLVVVVAANTKVHDGSRDQLLVNRVVTQTPIDALDVQTGVWYNRLLEHGITKNVSDVDVVRWNATAFAVVDRATREAAVFEWRPFPFALVKCSANTDCRACTTSEANEEPCRWCGTRCVSRLTFCLPTESSACVDPTTTTTTLTANVSLTTSATSTTEIGTTTTTSFVSTSLASLATSADSGADSSDPLLPLYIVLGVLGALVLAAGLAIAVIKVRDLKSRPAPKAVPMEEPPKAAAVAEKPKPAEFDADARYTQFEPDAEDPRYTSL